MPPCDGVQESSASAPTPHPQTLKFADVYTLHCTKKLLARVGGAVASGTSAPTTALGNWYATVLFWRPQISLLVNERTLLPVLMPLAPAATLAERFPGELVRVLSGHGMDPAFIDAEVAAMHESSIAKTANRSVVGMINEFSFLAGVYREGRGISDALTLAMKLADTPCSPLRGDSPARLLRELGTAGH